MNKSFLLLVFCLFTTQINGQELYIGGGGLCAFQNTIVPENQTRFGIEGTVEFKPFKLGLVASISPNTQFDNGRILYTLPFELKWLIGKKYKVYPAFGYIIRNNSFKGGSIGLGAEYEINEKLKAGLKCYKVSGVYRPYEHTRNIAYAELSLQIGVYLLVQIL